MATFYLQVDEAFAYDMVRILKKHIPQDMQLITPQGCFDPGPVTNETLQDANLLLRSFENVSSYSYCHKITICFLWLSLPVC